MNERFIFSPTAITGLFVVERRPIGDARGSLERMFCAETFARHGWRGPVAQVNLTRTTTRGTLRGLHFQRGPHGESKLISCLRGAVHDVVVDLRAGSPTFLARHVEVLRAEAPRSLLVPEGLAHGFQALSDDVEMLYFHSAPHVPEAESGVSAFDPRLGLDWPLPIGEMSARDRAHPPLGEDFGGLGP